MQFHPEPFSQGAARGLGRAINCCTRSEHFDPENGSDVNDVTALLLLLATVNTTTLWVIFDIPLFSPYLRICFSWLAALHRMRGPAISETFSTNEVKKATTSVQLERLALCPAHRGRRSDRPAASAGIARFLTSLRCNGYGRIAVPAWFSSSSKRLWI